MVGEGSTMGGVVRNTGILMFSSGRPYGHNLTWMFPKFL